MSVIDFHTHIVSSEMRRDRARLSERDAWFRELYSNPKAKLATAEQLVAAMAQAGVDQAVTFGFAWADMGLCREANDYVADAMRRYPEQLIGFAVVNPASGKAALVELERCAALGLRGVGELMPEGQGCALDNDAMMDPLLGWLAERGWPLLVHTNEPVGHVYPGKCDTSLLDVYRMAERYPTLKLVCAHWGGGLPFYELMPEVRAVLANVYYDTAASLYLYDAQVFAVVSQFAAPKILFGTDYPLIGYERFLRYVHGAGLPRTSLDAVLGGNALCVLSSHVAQDR